MNIEISDELAIELADAYAATFDGTMNYGRLVELVGALLVYIPDPRCDPRPQGVETTFTWIDEVPVTTMVLVPDPRAPQPVDIPVDVLPKRRARDKITPHQREVYGRIERLSRRRNPDRWVWVESRHIGSHGACTKLVEKGWVEVQETTGPRGGERFQYRPLSTTMSTPVDKGAHHD